MREPSFRLRPLLDCQRRAGFTLLELVVAISIAAILLGVSAPAMFRLFQSMQYQSAVADVLSTLSGARQLAISEGTAMDVMVNPEAGEIGLDGGMKQLPDGIRLGVRSARELNRDGAGVIRFYPDGGSSGGIINVTNDGGRFVQVQVDWLLGKVSQCHEDCEDIL